MGFGKRAIRSAGYQKLAPHCECKEHGRAQEEGRVATCLRGVRQRRALTFRNTRLKPQEGKRASRLPRSWSHTLSAKKTEAPRKKGGSPTALDECASGVRWQGASFSSVTRKSTGMSLAVGILYVPDEQARQQSFSSRWVARTQHKRCC